MTQCAKIIVGFTANVGNVFIKRLQTFLKNFPRFFYVFNVFYLNVHYIYVLEQYIATRALYVVNELAFRAIVLYIL